MKKNNQITKKSYNPFKMWGSYLALAIVLFIIILLSITSCNFAFSEKFIQMWNLGGPNCRGIGFGLAQILSLPMIPPMLLFAAISLPLGFSIFASFVFYILIGWAIHSLVRRLRR
ncbi:MAG: hypothetical protein KKF67_01230 [Nanoarchaeota archaeon]|nr:hypothetical protein [Nanoarchaeota archaeon]